MELFFLVFRLGICIPCLEDPLIAPGGVVTIGLQGVEPEDSRGVYWSLSLAHVRYYGDPVKSEGSVNSGLSRISIEDMWLVALGSMFALWGTEGSNTKEAANLIRLMWQSCSEALLTFKDDTLKKAILGTS